MKCTSRLIPPGGGNLKKILIAFLLVPLLFLNACNSSNLPLAYQTSNEQAAFRMFDIPDEVPSARTFAADLCVVPGNIFGAVAPELIDAGGAALFGTDERKVLYAKDVYEKLYPASLTKVMTALVALKYGKLDMEIIAGKNVTISESGVQVCGIKQGDRLTLSQVLHLSLINSANDAAIMVAEGVAGTVEEFVMLMNREARALGATGTNFMNPHGLSHDDQYTTIYDMYLILNAAIKYEAFNRMVQMNSYTTTYITAEGDSREISVNNTNQYLQGTRAIPEQVTVIGGKTGTTNAARHCLAIIAKDTGGKIYLSVIMRAETRDDVYEQTTILLQQINQ
ncbi:MAG: serine hydrolase [Lachnospiraceae bacterium]|nr:serine hydrolase [Lachnospiraceae bacterium]